jgi:hypothetical protein
MKIFQAYLRLLFEPEDEMTGGESGAESQVVVPRRSRRAVRRPDHCGYPAVYRQMDASRALCSLCGRGPRGRNK